MHRPPSVRHTQPRYSSQIRLPPMRFIWVQIWTVSCVCVRKTCLNPRRQSRNGSRQETVDRLKAGRGKPLSRRQRRPNRRLSGHSPCPIPSGLREGIKMWHGPLQNRGLQGGIRVSQCRHNIHDGHEPGMVRSRARPQSAVAFR